MPQPAKPRNTRQRDAVRAAIAAADRPLAPAEVHAAAELQAPGIGIATVYRTLNQLTEDGLITAVELPHAPARYETAHLHHHHHFSCRVCGRVFDIHGCPGGIDKLVPKGWVLESHEILLYGTCAECSPSKRAQ